MQKELPTFGANIAQNWVYKLVAFVVALSIWLTTVSARKDTILIRRVDVQFILKPNFVVAGTQPFVNVKVAGPKSLLKRFIQSNPTVNVDLSGQVPGQAEVTLNAQDLQVPTGIKILSFDPQRLIVEIKEVQ